MNANPMSTLRLLLLLATLLFAACTDPRSTSLSRLKHADAAELRAEVAKLYTRMFPAPGPVLIPVRAETWPAAIVKLRPLRLNLYRDGLAVSLQASPGFEYGLHILPTGATEPMKSTERTKYEKVQDGIYFFTQKR
jgi:hypothetical protein